MANGKSDETQIQTRSQVERKSWPDVWLVGPARYPVCPGAIRLHVCPRREGWRMNHECFRGGRHTLRGRVHQSHHVGESATALLGKHPSFVALNTPSRVSTS